jgi:hypothetical protein
MRWQNLFDDLEGQLEHELGAEGLDVAAEEERLRIGRLTLRDRLSASLATTEDGTRRQSVTVVLTDGRRLAPMISATGRDWIAGELDGSGPRRSVVIPLPAIAGIILDPSGIEVRSGTGPLPESPTDLSARLGIAFVLRDLCRRRSPIDVVTTSERLHGTIDRVGRDHLDLAEHPAGEFRRRSAVAKIRLLPFDALLWIGF